MTTDLAMRALVMERDRLAAEVERLDKALTHDHDADRKRCEELKKAEADRDEARAQLSAATVSVTASHWRAAINMRDNELDTQAKMNIDLKRDIQRERAEVRRLDAKLETAEAASALHQRNWKKVHEILEPVRDWYYDGDGECIDVVGMIDLAIADLQEDRTERLRLTAEVERLDKALTHDHDADHCAQIEEDRDAGWREVERLRAELAKLKTKGDRDED